jgi:hypothetical protein
MEYHDSMSTTVREEVVHAVTVYAQRHEVRRVREVAPGAYAVRHRHDTDGHRDESIFLAAIAAHPAVARLRWPWDSWARTDRSGHCGVSTPRHCAGRMA